MDLWGYNFSTKRLVTGETDSKLRLFDSADLFFHFNADAPESSASEMPSEYGLKCPERAQAWPDADPVLPSSAELLRNPEPCCAIVYSWFKVGSSPCVAFWLARMPMRPQDKPCRIGRALEGCS